MMQIQSRKSIRISIKLPVNIVSNKHYMQIIKCIVSFFTKCSYYCIKIQFFNQGLPRAIITSMIPCLSTKVFTECLTSLTYWLFILCSSLPLTANVPKICSCLFVFLYPGDVCFRSIEIHCYILTNYARNSNKNLSSMKGHNISPTFYFILSTAVQWNYNLTSINTRIK